VQLITIIRTMTVVAALLVLAGCNGQTTSGSRPEFPFAGFNNDG
jgi:hypothetical protein